MVRVERVRTFAQFRCLMLACSVSPYRITMSTSKKNNEPCRMLCGPKTKLQILYFLSYCCHWCHVFRVTLSFYLSTSRKTLFMLYTRRRALWSRMMIGCDSAATAPSGSIFHANGLCVTKSDISCWRIWSFDWASHVDAFKVAFNPQAISYAPLSTDILVL